MHQQVQACLIDCARLQGMCLSRVPITTSHTSFRDPSAVTYVLRRCDIVTATPLLEVDEDSRRACGSQTTIKVQKTEPHPVRKPFGKPPKSGAWVQQIPGRMPGLQQSSSAGGKNTA